MTQVADRDVGEMCRDEMGMHQRILAALGDGPRTVVQVAEALEFSTTAVMVWMMGMRRYGLIVESSEANDEDYFEYSIVKREQEGTP